MRLLLALSLLVAACATKTPRDKDSDGYDEDVDCDDARADVNPTAAELCDGADNDCDGAVDDEPTDGVTAYADADGDGWGDAAQPVTACDVPAGHVADATDCDDADGGAYPGAVEQCDGVDDDCDGTVDEDDAADASTWYADGDGDGWGDATQATTACEAPAGHVADGTDCDDADAAVHPEAVEDDCADPTDYNCDGSVAWADADGDGWAACEDCDDVDATRNPAVIEVCDDADVDDDCDGLADDADPDVDTTTYATWTLDADTDGYGADGGLTTQACDQPAAFVAATGDCDDADATVNPAGTEVCDPADTDEDCDGAADDADASATALSTWHADADGDGYGDAAVDMAQCEQPAGYVADATDCDDGASGVSPAATEACDAADTDEDCDGLADDDDGSVTGTSTWYADADADGHGDAATTTAACTAPAGWLATATDCDDGDTSVNPDATDSCYDTVDQDCDGVTTCSVTVNDASRELVGVNAGDYAGYGLSAAGDTNGDGYDDLLVGAAHSDANGNDSGAAYVVRGGASGDLDLSLASAIFAGERASDFLGYTVGYAGDLDRDGYDDVLLNAHGNDDGGTDAGKVYLFYGPVRTADVDTADTEFIGENASDHAGSEVVGGGDVNGDGSADLLIGAYGRSSIAGGVYILTSWSGSTVDLSTATAVRTGESANNYAGWFVDFAGDLDADGYDDVLVSAQGALSGAGAAYVLLGPVTGTASLSTADARLTGSSGGIGAHLRGAGDIDADGYDDFVVGSSASAAWVVYGLPSSGTIASEAAPRSPRPLPATRAPRPTAAATSTWTATPTCWSATPTPPATLAPPTSTSGRCPAATPRPTRTSPSPRPPRATTSRRTSASSATTTGTGGTTSRWPRGARPTAARSPGRSGCSSRRTCSGRAAAPVSARTPRRRRGGARRCRSRRAGRA